MKSSDSLIKHFFHRTCRHAACILFTRLPSLTGSRTIRLSQISAYIPRAEYAADAAVSEEERSSRCDSDIVIIFSVERKMIKPLINSKRALPVLARLAFCRASPQQVPETGNIGLLLNSPEQMPR